MPVKTSLTPSSGRLRVVHPVLPVLFTVVCLGTAVKLVPDKQELAKRQLKDGSHEQGLRTAMNLEETEETAPQGQVDGKQAQAELEEAKNDSAKLKELVGTQEGRAQLAEAILSHENGHQQMVELTELAQDLPKYDQEQLLRTVARRAINGGQPKLATLICSKLMQLRPEMMTREIVEVVVQSWRANNQAPEAAGCLKAWITNAQKKGHEVPEHLEKMYMDLLFETNAAGEALDLLLVKLKEQSAAGKVSAGLLASAIQAGNYSGRVKELRPYLAAAVASMPLGKAPLEEICAAVKSGKHDLLTDHAQWSESALELAHWFEWSETPDPNNSEQALALYEKLAVLGNAEALEKAAEMALDLQTMGNLLKVMDVVMHQPRPPAMEFIYGHLLGVAGRMEEADHYFQLALKKNPHDLVILSEYAALCQERDDLTKALATWKTAADQVQAHQRERGNYWKAGHQWLLPGEFQTERMDFRKREADLHIELKQNAEALGIYRSFQPYQHDNSTVENMALLAESLGDYTSLNRALEIRFAKLAHPSVNDYLELARSFELVGKEEKRMVVLQQGVAGLPHSLNLRRQYASALQDAERPGDAVELLEVPPTKDDLRSMSLYILAATQSGQHLRAAEFLKAQIGKRRDFPADVRLCLGDICQRSGQLDLARGYYTSVDANAITWPLLAEACFQTGAFLDAEKYQRRYLEDMDSPPADQLVFLGDICRMQGKEEAAQAAYDQAVESIRSKHIEEIQSPPATKVSTSFSQ
jgi:tetratricopeptide (TPR) repeat protein